MFDDIRKENFGEVLTRVHRPGGSGGRGIADFLENFLSSVVGDGAGAVNQGSGFRGVPESPSPSGIPSAGSILARRGAPGIVNITQDKLPTEVDEEDSLDLFDAVRKQNEIIGEGINTKEQIEEYERQHADDLTREDKERLAEMKEQIAEGIKRAEAEERALLRQQYHSGQIGQRMQENLFGDDPIIPGASAEHIEILDRALGRTQFGDTSAVTNEEILTIMDEILESNLSGEEKEERLDFIQARLSMRDEVMTTLDNVIEDRRGLERMSRMSDLELLGNEAEFNTTMLNFEFHTDSNFQVAEGIATMIDAGFEELTGKEIPPSIAPELENGEDGLIDLLIQNPDLINTTGFQQRVADIAGKLQIKHSDLLGMIQEGMEYGNLRVELWDNALNKNQFTPQSEEFAMAIFQVAESIVGAEMANKLAESKDLHMIMASQSGGMVGRDIGDGNKHGIGGLTDEAYERVGISDYESIRGDTAEELAALIRYIMSDFGDPVQAINHYKRTGIWGD